MALEEIVDIVTSGVVGMDFVSDILLIADIHRRGFPGTAVLLVFAFVFLVFYPTIIGLFATYRKFKLCCDEDNEDLDELCSCCCCSPWVFIINLIIAAAVNFIAPIVGIITPIWKLMGYDVLSQRQKVLLAYWKFGEAVFESLPQLVINCVYMTQYSPQGRPTEFSIISMVFSVLQLLLFVLNFPRNISKLRGDDRIFSLNV